MTRSFLALIQAQAPGLPMLALTDYDPYGINIYLCYRYGTTAFAHESGLGELNLTWLGIKSGHLLDVEVRQIEASLTNAVGSGSQSSGVTQRAEILSALTARDRKYAIGLLHKFSDRQSHSNELWEIGQELQAQLMLGAKAEIQGVDNHGDLIAWLDDKLQNMLLA